MAKAGKSRAKASYIKDSDITYSYLTKNAYAYSNNYRSEIFKISTLSDLNRDTSDVVSFSSTPAYAPLNAFDPITGTPLRELNMVASIGDFQQSRDFIDLPGVAGKVMRKGKALTTVNGRKAQVDVFAVDRYVTDNITNAQTLVYYNYYDITNSPWGEWNGSPEQAQSRQAIENAFSSIGPGQRTYLRLQEGSYRGAETISYGRDERGTLVLLRDESNTPYALRLASALDPVNTQINFV